MCDYFANQSSLILKMILYIDVFGPIIRGAGAPTHHEWGEEATRKEGQWGKGSKGEIIPASSRLLEQE